MSPEPRQLLVPATPYLKLGSFTKASTAVTPPKEWPMTATLVRSRLSCKRERAEESAQTSRGLEVSNWGRKSLGKMSRVSLEGGNAVSHCWWWALAVGAGGLGLCTDPSCPRRESLRRPGLILPPRGTQSPPGRARYLQHGEVPALVKDVGDRSATSDVLEEPQRPHTFLSSLVNLQQSALPWQTQPQTHKCGLTPFPQDPSRLVPAVLVSDGALPGLEQAPKQAWGSHRDTARLVEWFIFGVCF